MLRTITWPSQAGIARSPCHRLSAGCPPRITALRVPGVAVNELIQLHRRHLVELMQQWTHLKDEEADADLAFALVADAELSRLDSVIRWLDQAEGRLMRAELEPAVPSKVPRLRRRLVARR